MAKQTVLHGETIPTDAELEARIIKASTADRALSPFLRAFIAMDEQGALDFVAQNVEPAIQSNYPGLMLVLNTYARALIVIKDELMPLLVATERQSAE